ncbi:MAG: L-seryl-tRNA(Sec) selenium transferase [Pseudomonadota bacterium]
MSDALRQLPQVQALLETPGVAALAERYSRPETVDALRAALAEIRDALRTGALERPPSFAGDAFADAVAERIEAGRRANLRGAINATGIIIHTNLGRAPLAPEALEAIQAVAAGYSNLEMDLETGERGSRYTHVETLICELTGADAAIVVNNCAAAVLLSLTALASGRDVVASRGELIEIGGSFRLPDVIRQSGARLVEVGATNKTKRADYEQAIGEETAVLLKSHTSNFRIVGFTAAPSRADLSALARERGLVLVEDLGSGVLIDLSEHGLPDEPVVGDILKAGVDLVMFSGDKLLGGPQAGIIAGREDVVGRLRKHPMLRAMRIDKLSLAALEATLRLYRPPHDPLQCIPVLQALSAPVETVEARASKLAELLNQDGACAAAIAPSTAHAGGGALPQHGVASFVVKLGAVALPPDRLAAQLRQADPPVVARIADGEVQLDMRAVRDEDCAAIRDAVRGALRA